MRSRRRIGGLQTQWHRETVDDLELLGLRFAFRRITRFTSLRGADRIASAVDGDHLVGLGLPGRSCRLCIEVDVVVQFVIVVTILTTDATECTPARLPPRSSPNQPFKGVFPSLDRLCRIGNDAMIAQRPTDRPTDRLRTTRRSRAQPSLVRMRVVCDASSQSALTANEI